MISWSPERAPARGVLRDGAAAHRCVWGEFPAQGGTAQFQSPADAASVREQELDAAYRRGRAEGEQTAHARARRELETAVASARSVVREVREAREAWSRVLGENLAALATAVATHMVQRELTGDPGLHRDLVHQAMAAFPVHSSVRVRLHPADLAAVASVAGDAGDGAEGRKVDWVGDEEIQRGGCLLEGPERIVDGRVDEALKRIFQELAHG